MDSKVAPPEQLLLEGLNCALGDQTKDTERVSCYFGEESFREGYKSLTCVLFDPDESGGWLFDESFRNSGDGRDFIIDNYTRLKRRGREWRVGEIQGGIGSYTRLYYLTQTIASRPRQIVSGSEIKKKKPKSCYDSLLPAEMQH